MKSLVLLALVGMASAATLYPTEQAPAYGEQAAPASDGYGEPKQECSYYDDTKHIEHCEEYQEKVCATTQQESCADVGDRNCRGVVSSKQVRKCFDVTELRCSLKEDVKLETIQVPVTVQKCRKVPEKVCDTIYEASLTRKEKFNCIEVDKPKCVTTSRQVVDRTCRTTFNFDCQAGYGYAAPAPQEPQGYGADQGGQDSGYGGQGGQDSGYGSDNAAGDYSSMNSYGVPKPYCKRTAETKCYKTPRTVSEQKCTSYPEKVCEKLQENVPQVHPRQTCHNEAKRVCELVRSTQSKQIKKYVYSKQCRDVPRQICENADVKTLVPSCVPTTRKQCSYNPMEACENIPRKKCFQLAYKVRKQKCEKVKPSYPEPQPGYPSEPKDDGYGAQNQEKY